MADRKWTDCAGKSVRHRYLRVARNATKSRNSATVSRSVSRSGMMDVLWGTRSSISDASISVTRPSAPPIRTCPSRSSETRTPLRVRPPRVTNDQEANCGAISFAGRRIDSASLVRFEDLAIVDKSGPIFPPRPWTVWQREHATELGKSNKRRPASGLPPLPASRIQSSTERGRGVVRASSCAGKGTPDDRRRSAN